MHQGDNLPVQVDILLVQADNCNPEVVGMRQEDRDQLAGVGIHQEGKHQVVEVGIPQVVVADILAVVDNQDNQLAVGTQQEGSQPVDIRLVVDIRMVDILVVQEVGTSLEGSHPAAEADAGFSIYPLPQPQ
jgi:hypothetical protein